MSHSTVTVVIRNAKTSGEAEAQLEALLDPFDENREMDPYPQWCDTDDVERASRMYREHPEYCPGGQDANEDHGGPIKPFEEFVTEGNLEAWNEWTRQAVGAYNGNGRETGIYDAEQDRFGYLSSYNPDSRWDWWVLGGRWHGFFQLKPQVTVGSEGLPEWRTRLSYCDGVEGAQQIPNFDGSQAALLGNAGVGGDDPEENFVGRADLARKGDIDFDAMRAQAGLAADQAYDEFEKATAGLPLPESWQDAMRRVHFDLEVDPDETFDTYLMAKEEASAREGFEAMNSTRPPLDADAEREAWQARRQEAVNEARKQYREQPFIQALTKANLMGFLSDPIEDWCVHTGGRATYVQRAIDGSTGTFAVLVDGQWHERGHMGWFGVTSGEKDPEDWNRQQRRLLDSLPDDAFLAIVDVHI